MTDDDATAGVLICHITARERKNPPRFVSEEELREAANSLRGVAMEHRGERAFRHRAELSPGSIRIASVGAKRAKDNLPAKRASISAWSPKSRASMVARLATLDYRPLLADPALTVGLMTLTYPKDWEAVVPDGATAKRHLRAFQRRFHRRFGRSLIGCWKMEFQRRGAVHFHILTAVPFDEDFLSWLSTTWSDIVAAPDEAERRRHLLAGTNFEREPVANYLDANRMAVYFTKHGSAGFGPKEYQNQPPELWRTAGSVGRFWGYWGLLPMVLPVGLTPDDAIFLGRVLRRWARANAGTRREVVWRTNQRTGTVSRRHARRRVRRLSSGRGFLTVPDGSAMGKALARALTARGSTQPWTRGHGASVPTA